MNPNTPREHVTRLFSCTSRELPPRSTLGRFLAALLWSAAFLFGSQPASAAEVTHARFQEEHRAFLKSYCLECHNEEKQKGKIRLDQLSFTLDSVQGADLWQKILNQLNSGEMPPEDSKQPERGEKTEFLDSLSHTLMAARRSLGDSGGKITMRRLNRREYKNTIRDLLGVSIDVRDLPADGGAGTFDTAGSSLFMSSDQLEQYLSLGRKALDEAFARLSTPAAGMAKIQKLRKDPEEWANKYMPVYTEGYEKKHARFKAWCEAVDRAAARPENAEAVGKLREDPRLKTQPHLFYNKFAEIPGAPAPKEFEFRDVDDAQFARSEYEFHHQYYADYQKLPQRETGAYLMLYSLGRYTGVTAPSSWPAGRYTLRVRLAATDESPGDRRFIEVGTGKADASDFNVLSSHQVTGTLADPQVLEIPVDINSSGDRNFALRDKRPNNRAAEYALFREAWDKTGSGPRPCIWVDFVELEGPAGGPLPGAQATVYKERREVELHANAMVGGTYNGYFKGGYEAAKKFLETGMPQKGIPDEQEAKFRVKAFEENGPSFERYLNEPLTKTGAYLTIFNVHTEEVLTLPPDQPSGWLKTKHEIETAPPGEYILRIRIGAAEGTSAARRFLMFGSRKEKDEFTLLQTFQISGTTSAPQTLEVPVSITAEGPHTFVFREKRDPKRDQEAYAEARKATGVGPVSALWIDWVEWEGPLSSAPRPSLAKTEHIEPESKTAEIQRTHDRARLQYENYQKWQAAGAEMARLPEFGFRDRAAADFHKVVWEQNNRWFQQYLDWPKSKTGLYLDNTVNETSEYAVNLPPEAATGDYVLRVKIGRVPDLPPERAFLSFVEASPLDKDDRTFLANRQVTAGFEEPEVLELPFRIVPNGPRKFLLMEKRPLKKEGISLPGRTRLIQDPRQRDPALWIDWLEWQGPLNAPDDGGSQALLHTRTQDSAGAREVIERFAVRAFRDKVPAPEYVDKLVRLFEGRVKAGDSFESALKEPLSVVLATPRFLYLSEPAEEQTPRPLNGLELAARLSYFLWSAPPDDTLLALARSGELQKPAVLAAQVDRLIDSEKSREFVNGFTHQWLRLDRLDFFQFNTQLYRDFDESTKAAARTEVFRTVEHLLRANASVCDLLKADYVVVNGLLGTFYGLEGVSGDGFRKVSLPAGSPRGGLLGMSAVLAMGSNGEHTSPVERGAWVLRFLINEPPPNAPPNVPQITRLNGQLLTTRERLHAHQEQPQCASCHRAIDPIGFGLENFNTVGKWRTEDSFQAVDANGKPNPKLIKHWTIDPAGAFHRGPAFKDYFELRDIVASRPEAFARGLAENLIAYALGRQFGFADEDLAVEMVQRVKAKNFAMREFVQALTGSRAFRTK
jgi:hypothetical protein